MARSLAPRRRRPPAGPAHQVSRPRPAGGFCKFCGCSKRAPCPGGCAWVDEGRTICTACAECAIAWAQLMAPAPDQVRAFARGFFLGSKDRRGLAIANPYGVDELVAARYFDVGRTMGREALQVDALREDAAKWADA